MILQKMSAIFQLMRPVNVLITILSVWIAVLIAGPMPDASIMIIACAAAGMVIAAANTINDYYDVEIDRINKPKRVLPAGMLSARAALMIVAVEYLLGSLLAFSLSWAMFLIVVLVSALSVWYSAYLKRTVLWGNIVVSLISAMVFIYGGLAVHRVKQAVFPALFVFFFHFGREILKDAQDIRGDKEHQALTLPVLYGMRPAILLIWVNFIIFFLVTLFPYLNGHYSGQYFGVVVFGVYPVIFYVLFSILRNTQPDHLGKLSTLLKVNMLIGLLALYFR